jgi:hypothetical protein
VYVNIGDVNISVCLTNSISNASRTSVFCLLQLSAPKVDMSDAIKTVAAKLEDLASSTHEANAGEALSFFENLERRTLRIHTVDNRIFVGEFKCTDNVSFPFFTIIDLSNLKKQECNIILAYAYEYRKATPEGADTGPVGTAGLENRYVGMVVLPGHFIVKIEKEAPYGIF